MKKHHPYGNNNFGMEDDANEILRQSRSFQQYGHKAPTDEATTTDDVNEGQEAKAPAEEQELFVDEAASPFAASGQEESEEMAALKKELAETKLRSMAEVDNIRKRLQREKEESVRYAAGAVLSDLIPSLDNLDLALEHAKSLEACKDFVIGVEMTKKLLVDAMQKHGLQVVGALGDEFDPAVHEAVGMNPNPDYANNTICGLLSKGYKLNDRLLRPAKVIVTKN